MNNSKRNCEIGQSNVLSLLELETSLSYEERIRKALNLKPYLNYLTELFAEKLSDSTNSSEDDEPIEKDQLNFVRVQSSSCIQSHETKPEHKIESQANINSINNQIHESIELPHQSFLSEPEKQESFSASFNSSSQANELESYLDKPVDSLNGADDDYIMSILAPSSVPVLPTNPLERTNRKRKWAEDGDSTLSNHTTIPTVNGSSSTKSLVGNHPIHHPADILSLSSGMRLDVENDKEPKLKNAVEKLLTDNFDDFTSCLTQDKKLNLNQTAAEDDEDEQYCSEKVEDTMLKREVCDGDDDSLSDYMNITTAGSSLSLDPYFKFDTDELTSSQFNQSPISPTPSSNLLQSLTFPTSDSIMGNSSSSLAVPLPLVDSKNNGSSMNPTTNSDLPLNKKSRRSGPNQTKLLQIFNLKRKKLYIQICRKEIPNGSHSRMESFTEMLEHVKRLSTMCSEHFKSTKTKTSYKRKESAEEDIINLENMLFTISSHIFLNVSRHPNILSNREIRIPYHMNKSFLNYPSLLLKKENLLLRRKPNPNTLIYEIDSEYLWATLEFLKMSTNDLRKVLLGGILERWDHIVNVYKLLKEEITKNELNEEHENRKQKYSKTLSLIHPSVPNYVPTECLSQLWKDFIRIPKVSSFISSDSNILLPKVSSDGISIISRKYSIEKFNENEVSFLKTQILQFNEKN